MVEVGDDRDLVKSGKDASLAPPTLSRNSPTRPSLHLITHLAVSDM